VPLKLKLCAEQECPSCSQFRPCIQSPGSVEATAQIHPRKLTAAFAAKALELTGSTAQEGVVEGLSVEDDGAGGRVVKRVFQSHSCVSVPC
jgi:hypothetical protein